LGLFKDLHLPCRAIEFFEVAAEQFEQEGNPRGAQVAREEMTASQKKCEQQKARLAEAPEEEPVEAKQNGDFGATKNTTLTAPHMLEMNTTVSAAPPLFSSLQRNNQSNCSDISGTGGRAVITCDGETEASASSEPSRESEMIGAIVDSIGNVRNGLIAEPKPVEDAKDEELPKNSGSRQASAKSDEPAHVNNPAGCISVEQGDTASEYHFMNSCPAHLLYVYSVPARKGRAEARHGAISGSSRDHIAAISYNGVPSVVFACVYKTAGCTEQRVIALAGGMNGTKGSGG
jgi:hypothetical protein